MVQTEPTVTGEGAHRKTKPIAMGLTIARELTLQPLPLQPFTSGLGFTETGSESPLCSYSSLLGCTQTP